MHCKRKCTLSYTTKLQYFVYCILLVKNCIVVIRLGRHSRPFSITRRSTRKKESFIGIMHFWLSLVIKWSLGADWLIAAGAYPSFCSMKRLGVFLLPLDGILVHHRSLPRNLLGFPNNSPVPIYTPGWREALWELSVLPKNATLCPPPGLKPGPLDLEKSTLTIRPPPLHKVLLYKVQISSWFCP